MIGKRLSHYLIERRLGAGGMGEVYLAQDLALGRPAALKILRPDVADELRARLVREAENYARLQHPWIATFYEAGTDGEAPFLAMEYVPGRTLRANLAEGPLDLDPALSMATCLLEALAHAHAAGVLHRDIKPENVMIGENGAGTAKLLDFGIAAYRAPGGDAAAAVDLTRPNLTQQGHIMGTLGYMAPEQLRGGPIDARADLFAAGAVLYEAVAGRPAFPGATPTECIAAILAGEVPPIGVGATPALEGAIARALARNPGDRFPSAAAFLSEVRRLRSGSTASQLPDSLAVLDLENLSRNEEDNWITSGIAESLASDLARVPGLHVVSREKVLQTRGAMPSGSPGDALALGHRLGCRWVLSGGLQRLGPSLRITARLTEVPTGMVIAAEKVDGKVDGVFEMQDRLAAAVVSRLDRAAIAPSTSTTTPASVQAFELYARGRRFTDRLEKGTFEQAQELFEEAIRLEPRYAPALCGLAMIHALRFTFTTDPGMLDEAERYARRAIEVDPAMGEPYVWLSYAILRRNDVEGSFAAAQRAVALDPKIPYAHYFSGCAKSIACRPDEAVPHFQSCLALESTHGFSWLGLGWSHLDLGRVEEALWCLRKVVELEGTEARGPTAGAGGFLAEALRRAGDLEGARRAALQGLAAGERTDHMFRDTFRGISLVSLGRTALEQRDADAANAAFHQAVLHIRGRPRALGGGHLLTQALAGLARAGAGPWALDEAIALYENRSSCDFSWLWCCQADVTHLELARAARAVGRDDVAREYLGAARAAGSPEARKEEWA
ncbi:MAG TPA: protein kinase [Candidatus Eisenbacteria bacterium]|nr:protein kinase [Candidatus Eisenbacteria bacterium]